MLLCRRSSAFVINKSGLAATTRPPQSLAPPRLRLTTDQVSQSMEIKTARPSSARSTGLALLLDDGTRKSHSVAENTQFVTGFFKGISTPSSFGSLVSSLYFVYSAMEEEFGRCEHPAVRALDYPELRRKDSLHRDMTFYFGGEYEDTVRPSPATRSYVSRVREVAEESPELLVAHMYTRYLGDLFGGQMMGGMARSSLGLEGGGTDFYEFEDIQDTKKFIEGWYGTLNSLDLSDEEKGAIVDEGNRVFALNIDVFNELEGGKRAVARSLWRLIRTGVKSRFSRKRGIA